MNWRAGLMLTPMLVLCQPAGKVKILDLVERVEVLGPAKVTGLEVEETASGFRVEMAADVLFDFDSAAVRPGAEPALRQLASLIAEKAKGKVRIEGHTDGKGAKTHNQKLSLERAESVLAWLVRKGGIDRARMTAHGMGASKPVAPNTSAAGVDDPAGRQRNRRVEITVMK